MAGRDDVLLEIKNLRLHFNTFAGKVQALDGVDLTIRRNETLGLVGESGCGKSVTAMSILRLLPSPPAEYASGQILFHPRKKKGERANAISVLDLEDADLQALRGNDVSMIFQEPMTSLNPVMRVGDQIIEVLLRHRAMGHPVNRVERWLEARDWRLTKKLRTRRALAREHAVKLLGRIGIADPDELARRYPHELSGGMRQRVMIAIALACNPELLVADEPTTALDVTIQAQIMELMRELKRDENASILLITHHLGVVAEMCDRLAVMYAGNVVEVAPTREAFHVPKHPYTVGLLKSIPALHGRKTDLDVIPGTVPDLISPPQGCRFHPRCPFAIARCKQEKPELKQVADEHLVACHLYDESPANLPQALREAGLRRVPVEEAARS